MAHTGCRTTPPGAVMVMAVTMCLSLQRRVVLWARTGAMWDKGYQGHADGSIVKAWCIEKGGWKGICPH